jgi:hypothetical protein
VGATARAGQRLVQVPNRREDGTFLSLHSIHRTFGTLADVIGLSESSFSLWCPGLKLPGLSGGVSS